MIGWQGGRKKWGRNWTPPRSGTDLEGGAEKWGKGGKVKMASKGGQPKSLCHGHTVLRKKSAVCVDKHGSEVTKVLGDVRASHLLVCTKIMSPRWNGARLTAQPGTETEN